VNDIEERIADILGTTNFSINGAAGAALRGARGTPQDPFTGAQTFLFSDLYTEPVDVQIIISTAEAFQVVGIGEVPNFIGV
jgi:hypothetical protein